MSNLEGLQSNLIMYFQYSSSAGDERTPYATHDTSRVNYHVKHLPDFARTLEEVRQSDPSCTHLHTSRVRRKANITANSPLHEHFPIMAVRNDIRRCALF